MLVRCDIALLVALAAVVGAPVRAEARPVDVHPALAPAWEALASLRTSEGQDIGSSYARIARTTGVRLTVGRLPDGVDAVHDDERGRIVVSRDLLGEDPTALAALLAHAL